LRARGRTVCGGRTTTDIRNMSHPKWADVLPIPNMAALWGVPSPVPPFDSTAVLVTGWI
jgi:hypothetical protein